MSDSVGGAKKKRKGGPQLTLGGAKGTRRRAILSDPGLSSSMVQESPSPLFSSSLPGSGSVFGSPPVWSPAAVALYTIAQCHKSKMEAAEMQAAVAERAKAEEKNDDYIEKNDDYIVPVSDKSKVESPALSATANVSYPADVPAPLSESQPNAVLHNLLKGGLPQLPSFGNQRPEDTQENIQRILAVMKGGIPPITLPTTGMSGVPAFPHDLLWRLPNPYNFQQHPPPSPLENHVKSHLPGGLGHDPRCWNRDDVALFLQYCQREFDLDQIDMDKFQMNGKALCLLNKNDLTERCSGAGDVIHNILQSLVREAYGAFPPSSPLTPRAPGLMTPTSPAFPQSPHPWPLLSGVSGAQNGDHRDERENRQPQQQQHSIIPNLSHLISQTNSVTLSPAPSVESQSGGSPKHGAEQQQITSIHQLYPTPSGSNASSNASSGSSAKNLSRQQAVNNNNNGRSHSASSSQSEDSEDPLDSQRSPSSTSGSGRNVKTPTNVAPRSPKDMTPSSSSPGNSGAGKEETPELNTNGRLLWDFLQQLLNDAGQRYQSYIAWKDKDTGVFKIVDPPGLAKLWGIQKNHLSMNYDKMSRALRYYYRVNILRKVQGERHCYQFLRNPSELKSIKNISLLRQQMEAQAAAHKLHTAQQHVAQAIAVGQQQQAQAALAQATNRPESPIENNELPTDLTLDADEKLRLRERLERERRFLTESQAAALGQQQRSSSTSSAEERDREQLEARPSFDFRHLIPQVSLTLKQDF